MSQGVDEMGLAVEPAVRIVDAAPLPHPAATAIHYGRRALPALIGAVLLIGVVILVSRVRFLAGFNGDYSGSGKFQVTHCESLGQNQGQWRCDGSLTVDGRLDAVPSRLVTSQASITSDRPYVGEMVGVFFQPSDSATVYPQSARLGELTRLYVQLMPIAFLVAGSFLWVLGWASGTLGSSSGQQLVIVERGRRLQPALTVSDVGFGPLTVPSSEALRRRGWAWMVSGVGLAVAVVALGRFVLGSLGFP